MLTRARKEEDGFGIIELMAAVMIMSIAVLALMASYDSAFLSLHNAARQSAAATLADKQLELYSALSYSSIGLDATALSAVDATYTSDKAALDNPCSSTTTTCTVTDATVSGACSSSQCLPLQTLTGSDHRSYRVETFVRDISGAAVSARSERVVTVIVRDPNQSGTPKVATQSAAFDAGP